MKIPTLPDRKMTAFVREVVMPGFAEVEPEIDRAKCRFKLSYGRSAIHRWGIFADEDIPAGRRVIEYTGQKIDQDEVWRRSIRRHLYIFCVDDKWALDGAFGGSGAEFINHSCTPNLTTKIARGRIFLKSLERISAGTELTLDYKLSEDGPHIDCSCGSPGCKGIVGY